MKGIDAFHLESLSIAVFKELHQLNILGKVIVADINNLNTLKIECTRKVMQTGAQLEVDGWPNFMYMNNTMEIRCVEPHEVCEQCMDDVQHECFTSVQGMRTETSNCADASYVLP